MSIKENIQNLIDQNDICLFMKGTPEAPQCGFSMAVSNVLKHLNAKFKSVNVLEDQNLRQGIKDFSDWPTIPQLYVKGEFIGGCDIIKDMFESGELKDFFGEENILPRDINMYYYLQKAKGIYTTHISESCIYGIVTGKKTEPIDVWNNIQRGSFYCINNHLLTHQHDAISFINKTFSSYKSGIINPSVDINWK